VIVFTYGISFISSFYVDFCQYPQLAQQTDWHLYPKIAYCTYQIGHITNRTPSITSARWQYTTILQHTEVYRPKLLLQTQ